MEEARKRKTHQDWGFKFHLWWDFPSHTPPALDALQRALHTVSFSLGSPGSSIADYKRKLKYTQMI